MNRDLIKNNKEVFTHWLHGGDCLIQSSKGWHQLHWDSDWDLPNDTKLVINDLHVELRKAVVDGIGVQIYSNHDKVWVDSNCDKDYNFSHVAKYRVKQRFTVGSWIVNRGTNAKPFEVTDEWLNRTSVYDQEDFVKVEWRREDD